MPLRFMAALPRHCRMPRIHLAIKLAKSMAAHHSQTPAAGLYLPEHILLQAPLHLRRVSHFAEVSLISDAVALSDTSGCAAAQLSPLTPPPLTPPPPAATMPPATEDRAPMMASMLATASAAKPPVALQRSERLVVSIGSQHHKFDSIAVHRRMQV